jgi:hypothetical protein
MVVIALAVFAAVATPASAQISIGFTKQCKPVGITVPGALGCEGRTVWTNSLVNGGSNAPIVVNEAEDEFPFPGGPVLPMVIAAPDVLGPGDDAVKDNAACSDAPGDTCAPATGAGCALPCIICESLDNSVVQLDRPGEPGGTLTCPGILGDGEIHFLDDRPVEECPPDTDPIQPGDQADDQILGVVRNACEGDNVPANVCSLDSTLPCVDDGDCVGFGTCVPFACGEVSNDIQTNATTTCLVVTPPPLLANYKCYAAKPEPGTGGFTSREVVLVDQFTGDTTATVRTPFELCGPVRKEGIEDPAIETDEVLNDPGAPHLMCYKLVAPTIGPDVLLRATDQFGSLTHRVGNSIVLCQPALKSCFARKFQELVDDGADPLDPNTADEAAAFCVGAYGELDAKQAHLNCYNAFDEEQPFGKCSDSLRVCTVDEDCPGFGTGETCVELTPPVPYNAPDTLVLTDQFGDTLSDLKETTFHCNPLFAKTVDGGMTETFTPPDFEDPIPFPNGVPDGVEPPQQVHFRCYDIDDETPPDDFQDDWRNRLVEVQDQFAPDGAPIQLGQGTRLCEPEVKELLEEVRPASNPCGLTGIEALFVLAPLALLRRRKERRH